MTSKVIEEFAKLLVRNVRDVAIESCDRQLLPESQSPTAVRWRKEAEKTSGPGLANAMIPDCVDEAVFALLLAVDQGILRISITGSNGQLVDLGANGDGELGGWYMGSGGWRAQYSTQRFVDDFEDMAG